MVGEEGGIRTLSYSLES